MDNGLRELQKAHDRTWACNLGMGKEEQGNIEVNLAFLERVKLLRQDHDILEIGCGIGILTNMLTRRGYRIKGTDIATEAIKYGRVKYPGADLEVQAGESLSFADGSFDMVISFDALEHIFNVDAHLDEVYRVLRDNGYYLLATPNKYISAPYDTIKSRGFGWKWSHPSLQSWHELQHTLRRHGFSCEFFKMNSITDFTMRKLRRLGFLARLLKHIDTSRLPLWLQTNFYVVAQKDN
ncbi:MAG: class I SAM-dependent methyltransferase [Sedimentisphaerales bacterium]|nr:class I SAM-dependent methyltransferase [Sedimentisphaerales bacterium]